MSYFTYHPMTPDKKRIRLVDILPETHFSSPENPETRPAADIPVSCILFHTSLEDAPPYTALSYHWGPMTPTRPIIVGGASFQVTENLAIVLRHLRLRDERRIVWIDALSIDQNNNIEKSEQIAQMREIYSRAASVISWLGPSGSGSNLAMQWIRKYGGQSLELGIGTKPEKQLVRILNALATGESDMDEGVRAFAEDLKSQLLPANLKRPEVIHALSDLFGRPYWSRVWVVQEMASAPTLKFVCGHEIATEDEFHHALRLVRNLAYYHSLHATQDDMPMMPGEELITRNPIIMFKFRRAAEPLPLIYLIRSLRYFKATDPRDKIYSLLGIAQDTKTLGLYPDYQVACREVYIDLARTLIQHGYVELLSLCESQRNIAGLPSWVPDWSKERRRSHLQQRSLDRSSRPPTTVLEPKFTASGVDQQMEFPSLQFPDDENIISVPGTFVGEVSHVGPCWDGDIGTWLQTLADLSQIVSGTTEQSERDREAVWRTAVADQELRSGKKARLSQDMVRKVDTFLKDKELRLINEKTLVDGDLSNYCRQLEALARDRRPIVVSNRYIGIGPDYTEKSDPAYVILGGSVPYIMNRDDGGKLVLIGEAYIHGIMDGEAMEGDPVIRTVNIH
ncbi:heterokaryon incompatibility protein-domain-containing protein [Xylogone sp. PMI_703]|nr:heterokaryon incompatibility protein-domain-containing protein [Xylogone sp. PMI_703]